jgi:hypothetical protein
MGQTTKRTTTVTVDLGELNTPWRAWCQDHGLTPSHALRNALRQTMNRRATRAPVTRSRIIPKRERATARIELNLTTSELAALKRMAGHEGYVPTKWVVAMVRRSPQVIVKLVRAPKGMKGISNNLTYISRDGLLEIEDQDGQVIKGNEAVADLKTEWRDGGMPIAADSMMRDAFHLVLSMPQRTDPLSVQRAARDFAKREFSGSVRDGAPHV